MGLNQPSQLRRDPISGQPVFVAPSRFARPGGGLSAYQQANGSKAKKAACAEPVEEGTCPFCPGEEHQTPPAILESLALSKEHNGSRGWQVRVVPNKYPAVRPSQGEFLEGHSETLGGPYFLQEGEGEHEVVIETPRHVRSVTECSQEELAQVFWVYTQRLQELRKQQRWQQSVVFKNVGRMAGASLAHSHSQILSLPEMPPQLQMEQIGAEKYYKNYGKCGFCEVLAFEEQAEQRWISATDRFVAYCPFASRYPGEICILPREHASHFEFLPQEQTGELAELVKAVIRGIERKFGEVAYNWVIHSGPFDTWEQKHYHWHIEIIPRLAQTIAGFELGGGMTLNALAPETAAALLREQMSCQVSNVNSS
ncbi:UDPglucose--hexose-1-phosphate uridylyltransferase [Planctomycetales bacterium 10988]|nr:UDPglucose--hexose-1-phosphate uridylyltransferase [Planctomycetales bacterium 10988]